MKASYWLKIRCGIRQRVALLFSKVNVTYCSILLFRKFSVIFTLKAVMNTKLINLIRHHNTLVFEKDRLETFSKNWKSLDFKYCTPENFAAAGFYNFNVNSVSDTVKCFACQKELSDWEEDDDPWQEHVKRGNKCPFVIFKNKEKPTLQDFFELQYEIRKIIVNNYFDEYKQALPEKQKGLLKKIGDLNKSKK